MTVSRKMFILLLGVLILLACEIPWLSMPASPDPEPVPLETIIVMTAAAAQTQTAALLPPPTQTATLTPPPTATLTETPTPTETVIFILPTSTKPFEPHSAGKNCELIGLTPYKPALEPLTRFDTSWTLKNTGDDLWVHQNIDFRHESGTDMHKPDVYDLPKSVPPNSSVTITVAMQAPRKSGTYTTTWVLGTAKKTFCKVSTTVIVK